MNLKLISEHQDWFKEKSREEIHGATHDFVFKTGNIAEIDKELSLRNHKTKQKKAWNAESASISKKFNA